MNNLTVLLPYPQDLFVWLALFDRAELKAILALWRASLFAGFMGAPTLQFWFVALALADAARVRALALVGVLFAQAASLRRRRRSAGERRPSPSSSLRAAIQPRHIAEPLRHAR